MANHYDPGRLANRCIYWMTMFSVALLALIAAVVTFGHMRELALRHGESRWNSTLIPFSVDGMVVAASMSVLLASRTGRRREWLSWALLIVGSLASLAANVAVAEPSSVSRLIAAWSSFAFVGAYHLLQGQLMATTRLRCWWFREGAFSDERGSGPWRTVPWTGNHP